MIYLVVFKLGYNGDAWHKTVRLRGNPAWDTIDIIQNARDTFTTSEPVAILRIRAEFPEHTEHRAQ